MSPPDQGDQTGRPQDSPYSELERGFRKVSIGKSFGSASGDMPE